MEEFLWITRRMIIHIPSEMINTTEFKTAKMDNRTSVITIVVLLFLVLFPFSTFLFDEAEPVFLVTSFVLMYGAIIIAYCFVPKRIAVSDSQILIKNVFGSVIININEIKSILRLNKTGFSLRTFGVGGLFGYFGYFNGKDIWYVTNVQKKVQIILKSGKKYILSPENPEEFINIVQQRMTGNSSL